MDGFFFLFQVGVVFGFLGVYCFSFLCVSGQLCAGDELSASTAVVSSGCSAMPSSGSTAGSSGSIIIGSFDLSTLPLVPPVTTPSSSVLPLSSRVGYIDGLRPSSVSTCTVRNPSFVPPCSALVSTPPRLSYSGPRPPIFLPPVSSLAPPFRLSLGPRIPLSASSVSSDAFFSRM